MVPNAHDADDVLQDVLLTICARPHVFLQHCEPMNLIRSIASSRTVDFFRKASIRRHLSIEGVEVESANDSAEAETCQETNGEVARLIEGTPDLDGGERQLLYARAEGLSLKEIGRRFFLQPGTVSSKLTRAYAKIRRWATNSRCLTVGKVS
jgi:RNA polymerase sigma factor (sigma-70 family)